jgi:alkylation response protein AidB-like acyl-CoA dehydrogenase
MLGELGQGFKIAMAVLDRGRVDIAAMSLGVARVALDAAVAWAKERSAFSHKIAEYQGIQWMLADMATRLEAATLLTYKAAWARAQGGRFTAEASMAKLFASEAAGEITDLALQIHGGFGYTQALPLERYVRDARILRLFEGSSEIQRNIIARYVLSGST